MPDEPEVLGLLALMLLQESRREARVAADGTLAMLEEQDRSLWDSAILEEGAALAQKALRMRRVGAFQLQAATAALPAEAATGPQAGLRLLDAIEESEALASYYLLPAARADLLRRARRHDEAADAYRHAIDLCTNLVERRYLERRLAEVTAG